MRKLLLLLILPTLSVSFFPFSLQARSIEPLINEYLIGYNFSADNLFKLAAYTELKGRYTENSDAISLNFGQLGKITFFRNNCLLKTYNNQVFHLSRKDNSMSQIAAMNHALNWIFEHIALLANHNADPQMVQFVDRSLARKNIEPFNKIFVRHILINYGRYDHQKEKVEFHSDWIPESGSSDRKESALIQKYITPLKIQLDNHFLRGYYLNSGGTVYVEDVNRNVSYATGEEYDPNVTAFKVFVQKLFVQSAQYIAQTEAYRLEESTAPAMMVPESKESSPQFSHAAFFPENAEKSQKPSIAQPTSNRQNNAAPSLYHPDNWITMMLGILRAEGISIADPEVLVYFVDAAYFPKLYKRLSPKEKKEVDDMLPRLR